MKTKDIILLFLFIFLAFYLYNMLSERKIEEQKQQIQEPAVKKTIEKKTVKLRKKPVKLNLTQEQYDDALNQYNTKITQCYEHLQKKESKNAIDCFEYLDENFYDYDFYQQNRNAMLYNEAIINKKLYNYEKAKELLEEIIYYEKENQNLLNDAKNTLEDVKQLINENK